MSRMTLKDTPFEVIIYDKAFTRRGWLGAYESFTAVPQHNGVGTTTFTVRADHPRILDLMADGARVVVNYLGDFLTSGPVTLRKGQGPATYATVTFTIEDDYRILTKILGWPNPGQDIYHQGYDDDGEMLGDYHRISGPAETVFKGFLQANVARLGLPITIAPDQMRGDAIDVSMRFHPLTDRLLPKLEQAGLGMQVRQIDGSLVADVYEPVARTRPLTEESGVVLSWEWNQASPTNTRVVVGGQGEGIDRDFRLKTDAAREADWGGTFITEVFRDARDVELGNYGLLDKRADETLAEGAPKAGLALTLAETDTFRYGSTVLVGDQVTISVAPGVTISDVLRSATLSHKTDSGLLVTPAVGDVQDADGDMLVARAISRLAQHLRDLKAGR